MGTLLASPSRLPRNPTSEPCALPCSANVGVARTGGSRALVASGSQACNECVRAAPGRDVMVVCLPSHREASPPRTPCLERAIARSPRKVFVVTHTASVAALADQHLVVEKTSSDPGPSLAGANPPIGIELVGRGADDVEANGTSDTDEEASRPSATSPVRAQRPGNGQAEGGESPKTGRVKVAVREVRGRERELEVARMAAGDLGGGAAAELARTMLRRSGRQGAGLPRG